MDTDEKTDPVPDAPAEVTPPTAPDPSPDRLSAVEAKVNEIAAMVADLTTKPATDESPGKLPWTHRGGWKRDQ